MIRTREERILRPHKLNNDTKPEIFTSWMQLCNLPGEQELSVVLPVHQGDILFFYKPGIREGLITGEFDEISPGIQVLHIDSGGITTHFLLNNLVPG